MNYKKHFFRIAVGLSTLGLLSGMQTLVAFAEGGTVTTTNTPTKTEGHPNPELLRTPVRPEIKKINTEEHPVLEAIKEGKTLRPEGREGTSTNPGRRLPPQESGATSTENHREGMKEKIETFRLEKIKREITKLLERFNAAIERLTKLADRIDSRIQKLEAAGSDMTTAKADLADARTKIDLAKTKVAAIDATSTTNLSGTPGNEILGSLRTLVTDARQSIEDAQKALMKVIKDILPANAKFEKEHHATSTPQEEHHDDAATSTHN